MYQGKRILAFIPARAGSKGISDKNIIDVNGKPLIAYSIEAAKKSKYIDEVLVSTDGEKIAAVAKEFGANVPFLRPKELASDTSKTIDAVLHAIEYMRAQDDVYDIFVLLQPTQPLRTVEDVDGAIEAFFDHHMRSLVAVSEVDENPILTRTIQEDGTLKKMLDVSSTCRRQDMPKFYKVNGAIYINMISEISAETSFNDNEIPYIMAQDKAIDIDEEKDIVLARYYLEKANKNE